MFKTVNVSVSNVYKNSTYQSDIVSQAILGETVEVLNTENDFDNVKQVTWENDEIHGIKGLHNIRPKVEPVPSKWEKVLGKEFENLKEQNFWEK